MKRILDEFRQVIGYQSKSAIRLLCHRRAETAETTKRGGRPKKYGPELVPAL